jgi:leucyl aminopeptidase (aminopeptidase T)
MNTTRFMSSVIAFFVLFALVLAAPVDAATKIAKKPAKKIAYDLYNPRKKYGDEKKEIVNPESRCDTAANRKAHEANLVRAKQDGESFKISTDERVAELHKTYMKKLAMAWGAMEEPYCGFGAFGNSAAKKSYDKTVTRTRNEFLTEARKTQIAVKK